MHPAARGQARASYWLRSPSSPAPDKGQRQARSTVDSLSTGDLSRLATFLRLLTGSLFYHRQTDTWVAVAVIGVSHSVGLARSATPARVLALEGEGAVCLCMCTTHRRGRHHPRPGIYNAVLRSDRFGTGHRLGIQNAPAGGPLQITDHTNARASDRDQLMRASQETLSFLFSSVLL